MIPIKFWKTLVAKKLVVILNNITRPANANCYPIYDCRRELGSMSLAVNGSLTATGGSVSTSNDFAPSNGHQKLSSSRSLTASQLYRIHDVGTVYCKAPPTLG